MRQVADWTREAEAQGHRQEERGGAKVYAITSISWIAKKGAEIKPGLLRRVLHPLAEPGAAGQVLLPGQPVLRTTGRKQQAQKAEAECAGTGRPTRSSRRPA